MDVSVLSGFHPSRAQRAGPGGLGLMQQELGRLGITSDQDADLFTALIAGLISQQLANDPGGQRCPPHPPGDLHVRGRPRPAPHRPDPEEDIMNPRQPALPQPLALRLAATEYDRCATVFAALEPGHWTAATDCPAWDVRQMAAHMLGMAEMAASMRENLRQQRLARRAVDQAGASTSTPSPSFRSTSGQAGPPTGSPGATGPAPRRPWPGGAARRHSSAIAPCPSSWTSTAPRSRGPSATSSTSS